MWARLNLNPPRLVITLFDQTPHGRNDKMGDGPLHLSSIRGGFENNLFYLFQGGYEFVSSNLDQNWVFAAPAMPRLLLVWLFITKTMADELYS